MGLFSSAIIDAMYGISSAKAASDTNKANIEIANKANQHAYDMWQEEMAFNSSEAAKQRQWEQEMSNTAYQRARADMEAAGINPILLGSGAQSASAGTGYAAQSASAPTWQRPTIINIGQNGINTALKSSSIDSKAMSSLLGKMFG